MNQSPPPPPVIREVHHHHHGGPEPGIAVVLEVLPGLMLQTFGIGLMYAGNVTAGILMMIGYWVTIAINFVLCFFLVGFFTWPLTWIAFMIMCPILASNTAKQRQMGG